MPLLGKMIRFFNCIVTSLFKQSLFTFLLRNLISFLLFKNYYHIYCSLTCTNYGITQCGRKSSSPLSLSIQMEQNISTENIAIAMIIHTYPEYSTSGAISPNFQHINVIWKMSFTSEQGLWKQDTNFHSTDVVNLSNERSFSFGPIRQINVWFTSWKWRNSSIIYRPFLLLDGNIGIF